MSWTTPKVWTVSELVTASDMNTYISDNLTALKTPPSDVILRNNEGAYSTTSTSFVAVDDTNLAPGITTNGGDVMVWFWGQVGHSAASGKISFDIRIDGTTRVGADFNGGLLTLSVENTTDLQAVSLGPVVISGLSAGAHSFELMWKTGSGTAYLQSDDDSGNANKDVPVGLAAREVS